MTRDAGDGSPHYSDPARVFAAGRVGARGGDTRFA